MYVNRCFRSWRRKCNQERRGEDSKYKDLTTAIQRIRNLHSGSDTSHNIGNWNYLHFIHKIPDQQTGTGRNQGTKETSHLGHYTHTAGSADVKVQNM